jgi:hypothetical protein
MKFYKYINYNKYINANYVETKKITCIYINDYVVVFFKNGLYHSNKNAAHINNHGHKEFYLNNQFYGDQNNFTKESWRRFVKLQAFL